MTGRPATTSSSPSSSTPMPSMSLLRWTPCHSFFEIHKIDEDADDLAVAKIIFSNASAKM